MGGHGDFWCGPGTTAAAALLSLVLMVVVVVLVLLVVVMVLLLLLTAGAAWMDRPHYFSFPLPFLLDLHLRWRQLCSCELPCSMGHTRQWRMGHSRGSPLHRVELI